MKKLSYTKQIAIAVMGYLSSFVACAEENERPNIVLILADDLGYNDVGFTGETEIQTPNIDQLASDGIIFKNGYVTHPYCGPSRAGLLTGRYQARFGMENNVSYAPDDKYMGLPVTETTFPKRLQVAGYETAVFGKWHLGGAPHFQPNNRGFDYFYGFLDGGHNYMPGEATVGGGGYLLPLMRNKGVAEFDEYLTTALSNDAARYIQQTSDKPFFMYMSYNAPHAPLQAPQSYIDKYSHIENKQRRIYAAMVDAMDDGIGTLINALKEAGKFDNTLIFFLSDNGGVYPEEWLPTFSWADNTPFRRGKVALLEGGVHVPFIAHWPNKIKRGQTFEGLVSSLDIAATSVALAGARNGDLDGVDLVPYVTGQKRGSPHHALFWRLEEAANIYAVRTMDAKYMRQPLPNVGRSYFDMLADPYETENLVDQYPEKQAYLAELWNEWNSKNVNSVLYQSWEYKKAVSDFYETLHQKNVREAKQTPTYKIE
ncbi:sulfatase family protein [Echinimonas agarilytica]|uniref:Sulfatase-like hydrolase/transferase n=1 Tax=Echinimonas agarilytica TaxID=1215918 RepID=A0AA42B6X9_9GAMM|nr:sulfatase-like hydrolase/transferase [Echinimonas agarilytica]MCM2678971.1 sulfatase-like hydrolase/transferase [Echinimonas agarilytica]